MKALINRIIEFSNVDGPGNRLSIFFQGCDFNCLYCHNPETINICNNCGLCVDNCPGSALTLTDAKVLFNKELCTECDTCIKGCPYFSDPKAKEYKISELLEVIKDNQKYIRGITVSGGECMNYPDFVIELFKEVKKLNLSCLIDSNGNVDFSLYPKLLEYCDGVMLDIKAVNDEYHIKLTGKSNKQVLLSLDYLLGQNKLTEVRTVLLPELDDINKETIKYVIDKTKNLCDFKLIKYRPYGVSDKGKEIFGFKTLAENQYQELVDYARELQAEHLVLI